VTFASLFPYKPWDGMQGRQACRAVQGGDAFSGWWMMMVCFSLRTDGGCGGLLVGVLDLASLKFREWDELGRLGRLDCQTVSDEVYSS
jgi:hypothetical protein